MRARAPLRGRLLSPLTKDENAAAIAVIVAIVSVVEPGGNGNSRVWLCVCSSDGAEWASPLLIRHRRFNDSESDKVDRCRPRREIKEWVPQMWRHGNETERALFACACLDQRSLARCARRGGDGKVCLAGCQE